jgi:hypothetical protein
MPLTYLSTSYNSLAAASRRNSWLITLTACGVSMSAVLVRVTPIALVVE